MKNAFAILIGLLIAAIPAIAGGLITQPTPVASTTIAGRVKCDGITTTCAGDGTITATAGGTAGMTTDALNATLPDARTNLGLGTTSDVQFGTLALGGALTLSTAASTTPSLVDTPGVRGSWYGDNPGQRWQLAIGSAASPITTKGSAFSISEYFRVPLTECTAFYNTGCASGLLIDVTGDALNEMITSGITVHAASNSTQFGAGAQALNAVSDGFGSSTGAVQGAYIQGRRNTTTVPSVIGAEISSANYTTSTCALVYTTVGECDGIWLVSRGTNNVNSHLSSALHIGNGEAYNTFWREGITFNPVSVADTSIMDKSTSTTSIKIAGTHTTAISTDAAAGKVEFGGNLTVAGSINGTTLAVGASATTINAAIDAAIGAGKKGITLEQGTYTLVPTGTAANSQAYSLLISGASDFTFDCNGSTLLIDSATQADYASHIYIFNSNHVAVKNCIFDYAKLPFAQATLTTINATTADFTLNAGYTLGWPTVAQIEEFTPSTIPNVPAQWVKYIFTFLGGNRAVTSLGSGVYRVDFAADAAGLALLTVGHSYLLAAQVNGFDAIYTYLANDLVFDNVVCYSAVGSCFSTWAGTNLTSRNGSGGRLKPNTDRWRSVSADVYHLGFTNGIIDISTPFIQSSGDDGINVFGLNHNVVSVADATHFVLSGVQSPGFVPRDGDVLQFIDTTGAIAGTATVVSTVVTSTIAVTSTDTPVGFANTWRVANASASPTATKVTDGYFGYLRGRAVLCNSQSCKIENNYFEHLTNGPIQISSFPPEFNQGPVPSNVSIIGNVSEHNNSLGLNPADYQIYAYNIAGSDAAPAGTISGVVVKGNVCRDTTNMCVFVAGGGNVSITGNTFDTWATNPNGSAWHGLGPYGIGLYNVSGVRYGANSYITSGLRFSAGGTNTDIASVAPLNFQGGSANINTTATVVMYIGSGNVSACQTCVAFAVPISGYSGKFLCYAPTPPGVGKSVTFTIQKNGVDAAQTCVISDTDKHAIGTGSISFAAGDFFDITVLLDAAGTPSTVSYSLLFDVP